VNKKLIRKVEIKIGRQILRRGDCQYLSDRISNEYNKTLSYNTIRRAFGLDFNSNVKASKSTLDILSNFIGYNSYDEYNRLSNYSDKWTLKLNICSLINRMDSDEIINHLNGAWHKNENFSISFVGVIRELLLLGKVKLVIDIILETRIDLQDLNYSELLFVGNGIGSVLRKIKLNDKDLILLLKNKFFLDYVFLIFVDYSSINNYYGSLYSIIKRKKIKLPTYQNLFFLSIDNFRSLLLNKEIKLIKYLEINKKLLHPILIGRLASIEIAACKQMNINYDYVLNDISTFINSSKNIAIDYLYEIKTISLLTKDFSLMEWIISQDKPSATEGISNNKFSYKNNDFWYNDFLVEEQYQHQHLQYTYILLLILAIRKKVITRDKLLPPDDKVDFNIELILKRINKENWVISYYSYLDLFFQIGNYYFVKEKSEKNKFLNKYNTICTDLNYPIFDKNYLINYFD
jgi:hypothetical protein